MNTTQRWNASRERMNAVNLRATDKRFGIVHVIHQDGSSLVFHNAFAERDPEDKEFVWVYSEHVGYHLFHIEDLRWFDEKYND